MRPKPTSHEISDAFHDAWDEFGDDKSTEFLIAITSDRMGVSYERVVDALAETHDGDGNRNQEADHDQD